MRFRDVATRLRTRAARWRRRLWVPPHGSPPPLAPSVVRLVDRAPARDLDLRTPPDVPAVLPVRLSDPGGDRPPIPVREWRRRIGDRLLDTSGLEDDLASTLIAEGHHGTKP